LKLRPAPNHPSKNILLTTRTQIILQKIFEAPSGSKSSFKNYFINHPDSDYPSKKFWSSARLQIMLQKLFFWPSGLKPSRLCLFLVCTFRIQALFTLHRFARRPIGRASQALCLSLKTKY